MPPVQQAVGTGSGTSFTVTLGAAPLPGSTLVFLVMDEVLTGVSVTGGGATWEQGKTTGTNYGITYWIGKNCSGASGLTTITYNMTSSATVRLGNVSEWANLDTSPMDWKPAGLSGSTAGPAAPAVAPTRGVGVSFALVDWKTAVTIGAAAGGYTNLTQATGAGNLQMQGAYREFTSLASATASWTLSGATPWDTISFDLLAAIAAPLAGKFSIVTPTRTRPWTMSRGHVWYPNGASIPPVTGTGGLAFGFSESGTGTETITGTGAWAKGFTESGTGTETMTGTGGIAKGFSLSGTGTETITGSGGVAKGFSLSGTGTETIATGTGGVAFRFTEAGTGVESFTGTGGVSFRFAESGVGAETFTGTGGVAFRFAESGTGTAQFTGSGGVAFRFAESGTGAETITGSGGDAFTFAESGTGQVISPVSGSGGAAFGFALAGQGQNASVQASGRRNAGFITFPKHSKKRRAILTNPLLRVEVTPEPVTSQPVLIGMGGCAFGFGASGEGALNDDDVLLALM